ncbi:hypothetical protein [Malaciobacter marinus]|uniref:hypothetical protein n=1 Tax=Malaciobacter marinus TaxID=505249 RepID=UPI0009C85FF7|nr:hypothetical protein [Malaciobacter marinus]SKB64868.1 hypothetical protein SAMN06295997_1273 [Malaciobacter marinus]
MDYYENTAIPLLFQAKKAIHMYDGYLQKLNYKVKGAVNKQYELLESYAKSKGLNPYYLIYTIDKDSSIFMLDINSVKSLATFKNANEFYKLFCEKFYWKYLYQKLRITSIDDIPNLNQYFNEEMIITNKYIVKNLAIFDLRNIGFTENFCYQKKGGVIIQTKE